MFKMSNIAIIYFRCSTCLHFETFLIAATVTFATASYGKYRLLNITILLKYFLIAPLR